MSHTSAITAADRRPAPGTVRAWVRRAPSNLHQTVTIHPTPAQKRRGSISKKPANETEERTYRLGQLTLAGIFAGIGIVLIAGRTVFPILLAIPCFVMAAKIVYTLVTSPNYSNEQSRTVLRELAQKEPLEKTVGRHGWEKIFQWKILTPVQLRMKFREMANRLDLESVLRSRDEAEMCADNYGYSLPEVGECKLLWKNEITKQGLCEAVLTHNLGSLLSHNIVSRAEYLALKEVQEKYAHIKQRMINGKGVAEKTFKESIRCNVDAFQENLNSPSRVDTIQYCKLLMLAITYLQNVDAPIEEQYNKTPALKALFQDEKHPHESHEIYKMRLAFLNSIQDETEQRNQAIEYCNLGLTLTQEALENIYTRQIALAS